MKPLFDHLDERVRTLTASDAFQTVDPDTADEPVGIARDRYPELA